MRLLLVMGVACLSSCSAGDGETWSVKALTGSFAGLDGCACTVRDNTGFPATGRFSVIACQRSQFEGVLELWVRTTRTRAFTTGHRLIDGSGGSPFVAEAMHSEKHNRFAGSKVETPYRALYVEQLLFEGTAGQGEGRISELRILCDTYVMDHPRSPFFDPSFDSDDRPLDAGTP